MMSRHTLTTIVKAATAALIVLAAPRAARAQSIVYEMDVPLVKTVPNPCTTGAFVLVTGNAHVTLATVQSTEFRIEIGVSSSGRGDDATSSGTVIVPAANPAYIYTSSASGVTTFPNGVPAEFAQTVTLTEYLSRNAEQPTTDAFLLKTVLELSFANGVPTVPALKQVDIRCSK